MEQEYQYYAFVSYRSSDEKWAKWVQQQIEAYKLPAVLQKKNPQAPKTRIRPLFRYHTDIQPNELKEELRSKLEQSQYLLVICSPRSAQSQWVGQEIVRSASTPSSTSISRTPIISRKTTRY